MSEKLKMLSIGRVPLTFAPSKRGIAEDLMRQLWSIQSITPLSKGFSLVKFKKDGVKLPAMHRRSFGISGRYYFVFSSKIIGI